MASGSDLVAAATSSSDAIRPRASRRCQGWQRRESPGERLETIDEAHQLDRRICPHETSSQNAAAAKMSMEALSARHGYR
jgi:hypothetical protein